MLKLGEQVARHIAESNALCDQTRHALSVNRALMALPQLAKRTSAPKKSGPGSGYGAESVADVIAQRQEVLLNFAHSELELALTFAAIAEAAKDSSKRQRLLYNAVLGYETAMRCLLQVSPAREQKRNLRGKFQALREKIIAVGKECRKFSSLAPL